MGQRGCAGFFGSVSSLAESRVDGFPGDDCSTHLMGRRQDSDVRGAASGRKQTSERICRPTNRCTGRSTPCAVAPIGSRQVPMSSVVGLWPCKERPAAELCASCVVEQWLAHPGTLSHTAAHRRSVAGAAASSLLHRTPGTSYVSTGHCGPVPPNTALDGMAAASGTASAFDRGGLHKHSLSRPAG